MGNLLGIEAASKQAFSQARAKILPEGFQELHKDGIRAYYTSASNKGLWRGYRLIACDGSTLRIPTSGELAIEFGKYPEKKENENYPVMARISEYSDIV